MKRLLPIVAIFLIIPLLSCNSGSSQEEQTSTSKKISLNDARDILDISLLLPDNFEELDAASEGLSNKDLELGSDASEVYVFFSEDEPLQLIYHFIGITESRIEAASFDNMIEDEAATEAMLIDSLQAGAEEEGIDLEVPDISISHPEIGDKALLGIGSVESYGFIYELETLFFRINHVYYYGYSFNWSTDKVSLESIAQEIEKRINNYQ